MNKKILKTIAIFLLIITIFTTVLRAAEELESNEYIVTDNYISRVMPETKVEDFKNNLSAPEKVKIYKDANLTMETTSGFVATNMYLTYEDTVRRISVVGDVNGDGLLNQVDLTKIIRHISGKQDLKIVEDIELESADVTGDSNINNDDVQPIINYIVFGELLIGEYPAPEIIDIQTTPETNSVTVKVIATNMDEGTYQYSYKEANESEFKELATIKQNAVIMSGLKENTKYIIKIKVINKYGKTDEKEVEVTTKNPEYERPDSLTGNITWENGYAKLELMTDTEYTIQYQVNSTEGQWINGDLVTGLNHGDVVYARLTDGTTTGPIRKVVIRDNNKPIIEEVTSSKNADSISLTIKATDNESGLTNDYIFYIKKTNEDDSKYEKVQTGNSTTLNKGDLKPNTDYTVKVETSDRAGNIGTFIKEFTTDEDLGEGEGELEANITWENGYAKAELITNTSYTIQYQVNTITGQWTDGDLVTGLKHGDAVYARLTDGSYTSQIKRFVVQDTNPPIIEEVMSGFADNIITLEVTAKDDESGLSNQYTFYIKKSEEPDENYKEIQKGESTSITKSGLEKDTNYTIKVETKDNAGNIGEFVKQFTPNGEEGLPEGYMRIHLYYPEGSVNRQWRIGRPGESRESGQLVWEYYNDEPITVRIDDIKNIWLRYDLDGVEVVKAPKGTLAVDIRVNPTKANVKEVTVSVYFEPGSTNQKVKVDGGGWRTYKEPFTITENCKIEAMAEKEISVTDSDGNFLGTTTIKGKDSFKISNIGEEKEKDESLEAPTIVEVEASGDEKARVRIDYPTDKGDILKVYKLNKGPEITYTGEIPIEEWGTEIIAYYYKDNKQSKKDSKKFEDSTKLEVDIIVQPNPATDESIESVTVEIEYSEEAEKKTYKIDGQLEIDYVGPFTVNENCTITAYAKKEGINDARATETIQFKVKKDEIKAPKISQEEIEDELSAVIIIEYDENAVIKQYSINGGELQEYSEPFKANDGDVIYAINTSEQGNSKDATHTVEIEKPELKAPTFNQADEENKNKAVITIKYDENAVTKQYSINGGELIDYVSPIEAKNGDVIYAINKDKFGQEADATHTVEIELPKLEKPKIEQTDGEDGETYVTITYAKNAVAKRYSINGGVLLDYIYPIEVRNGDVIYAVNEDEYGQEAETTHTVKIDIKKPTFEQSEDTNKIYVTITYAKNAVTKQYSINGEMLQNYTGPIEVKNGDIVYAINKDISGTSADATHVVKVMLKKPTFKKSTNEDRESAIITITYDDNATKKQYSINGGQLLDYTVPIQAKDGDVIFAINTDDNGGSAEATYDVKVDKEELKAPKINVEYSDDKSNAVITIEYDERAVTKKYKVNSGELKDYTVGFEATKNGTVIYAVNTDDEGNSKESTYIIKGIEKKLDVSISITPNTSNKVDQVIVTITYDEDAIEKTYSINGKSKQNYVAPFIIDEKCTIVAEAKAEDAYGKDTLQITNIKDGIAAPVIKQTKQLEKEGEYAVITIEYDPDSISNTYTINNGSSQKYSSSFEIRENNTIITAYSVDNKGNTAVTQYEVKNLERYLLIDKDKYYWITLPYPEEATNKEYKYKSDGTWKKYKEEGFVLIKSEYAAELIQGNKPIKLETYPDVYVDFDGHWYLFDGDANSLQEDIYMRWDDPSSKDAKIAIQILALPEAPETTDMVDVFIIYSPLAVVKQYKIDDGEYQDYTEQLAITKNNTVITAKCQYADGSWSDEVSYTITNIDENVIPEGDISITEDITTITKGPVEITISYNPTARTLKKKYKIGTQGWQYTEEDVVKLPIEENIAIYAAFENLKGESSEAVVFNVENIDEEDPVIKSIEILDVGDTYFTIETKATDDTEIVKYEYKLDDGEYEESTKSKNYRNLTNGVNYKVTVRVTDAVGNIAEKSINVTTGVVLIRTVNNLKNIAANLEADYLILNDLDLSGIDWVPIEGFAGSLNGGGYTISNLTITKDYENVGLFGSTVSGAEIANLTLDNVNIDASGKYIGALVGKTTATTFDNIKIYGDLTIDDSSGETPYVGSVAGNNGTFSNVEVETNIKVSVNNENISIYAGGLSGGGLAATNSKSSTNIDINGTYKNAVVGGFSTTAGSSSNCMYNGDINVGGTYSKATVGGFTGQISGTNTIDNVSVNGNIVVENNKNTNSSVVGGLIATTEGYNYSRLENGSWRCTRHYPTIKNSYVTGKINAEANSIGGLIASTAGTSISLCYTTCDITGIGGSTSYVGGIVAYAGAISNEYAYMSSASIILTSIGSCYTTGNIDYTAEKVYAGGIAGAGGGTISNTFATGNITLNATNAIVGGIMGYQTAGKTYNYGSTISAYINKSYAMGRITGGTEVGGIIGKLGTEHPPTISATYYIQEGIGVTPTNTKGTAIETFALGKNASSYGSLDFSKTWIIKENTTTPYLQALPMPDSVKK